MPAEWTFLLYIGGVNSLAGADEALIQSLVGVDVPRNFNFLYQLGTEQATERGRIFGSHGDRQVLSRGPRIDTASPASLTAFIDWAGETFPSQHVALVLKDHGGGLDPAPGTWSIRAAPMNRAATADVAPRIVLEDMAKNQYLSNPDLREAVEGTRRGGVDILGFDACSMSVFEIAYELRAVASFMVATEAPESTTSWRYDELLEFCAKRSILGPRDLAEALVTVSPEAFLAAFELAWVDKIAKSIDKVAVELIEFLSTDPSLVNAVQGSLTAFQPDYDVEYVDLGQLLKKLESELKPDDGGSLLKHIKSAKDDLARACVARKPMSVSGGEEASGALILFPPSTGSPYLASYGWLQFAQKNRWTGLLGTWCSSGPIGQVRPHVMRARRITATLAAQSPATTPSSSPMQTAGLPVGVGTGQPPAPST